MNGGVVEDENMIIVRIMLLKDIHRVVDLPENVLVSEVPFSVRPGSEEYSSGLRSVWGTQPAIVSGDEVRDHQRGTFTLRQGDRFLTGMNPATLPPIVHKEYTLIVEPENGTTGWRGQRRVDKIGDVIFVPDSHCWLALSESRKVNVLTVVDNVGTLVAIKICALRCLSPCKIELRHPLASSVKSDRLEDVITLGHIRLPHEIDNGLGGNVCPDIGDMSPQLLDKISVVEEGPTAGVRVVMVREIEPIANEVLAPCSKPSTAVSALPKDGSSIISGLDPPSTSGIEREKSIKMIEPSPQDIVCTNRRAVGFENRAKISQSQSGIIG